MVGLNAPQTPNQNCADDNNIQIISFVSLAPFLNCENLALGMRHDKAR